MKADDVTEQLEEVRRNVAEVVDLIKGDGFFVRAKNLLYRSQIALNDEKISECLELVNRAKESALEEKEILSKLNETQLLISKKLVGSNRQEARTYHDQCLKFLKKGKVNKAVTLADEAKIAAQPPPEYLLQKARDTYSKGFKNYEEEQFQEAIVCWKTSIDEYRRARDIAIEKKDQNMIKNIDSTITKTNDWIKDAEKAFDNREMVKFYTEADKKIEGIEELIDQHNYDDVIALLNDAKDDTQKSLELAEIRRFDEDKKKIVKRIDNIEQRIEFYQIEKGKYLLEDITKRMGKAPEQCEIDLYSLLEYLNSLNKQSKALKQVVKGCKKAIVDAKLTQAKNNMAEAENLYNKENYYDAREIYEKTQEYLAKVEDEAGRFKLVDSIDDVRKLRTICSNNRDNCNDQYFNLPDAPVTELIRIKDLPEWVPPDVTVTPGDKHKLKELRRDYDDLNYLGGGAFADVFKARWRSREMIVALKVPRELTSSGERVFIKEFKIWERLKHRNIVKLIEPRLGPIPHLVIEYIDGSTLKKMLKTPRLDVKEACRIANDIAAGLECAHSNNIIHCDLKPENILISNVGEAKLTDFGTSKTKLATSTTAAGGRTLIYAAPEQLNGTPDYATDVYQLGLILYQMITGVNPFDVGSMGEIEEAIFEKMPKPPSSYVSDAELLDEIIMSCLAKKSNKRPSLRVVRQVLYTYMKKYHGESLILTTDNKSHVNLLFTAAFDAIKNNDIAECIRCLKSARGKVTYEGSRHKIESFVRQLEILQEEDIKTISDKTIDEVERLLKKEVY